jgi:hypothetical protein
MFATLSLPLDSATPAPDNTNAPQTKANSWRQSVQLAMDDF